MAYKVKNVPDTKNQKQPTGYSCWLDYWEHNTGQTANKCACCGQVRTAKHHLVGAHVYCDTLSGHMAKCIIPLCNSCNQIPTNQAFYINDRPIVIR